MSENIPSTSTKSQKNESASGKLSDAEIADKRINSEAGASKTDSKPTGYVTSTAYFIQFCHQEEKNNHPGKYIDDTKFKRNCIERWMALTDKEKKPFQDMATDDKKRYEREMQDYLKEKTTKDGKQYKNRAPEDPLAPKEPWTTFEWFCNINRPNIKQSNFKLASGEISKVLGRLWSELTPADKSKYEAYAKQEKLRYDTEMAAYNKLPVEVAARQNYSDDGDEVEDNQDESEDDDE